MNLSTLLPHLNELRDYYCTLPNKVKRRHYFVKEPFKLIAQGHLIDHLVITGSKKVGYDFVCYTEKGSRAGLKLHPLTLEETLVGISIHAPIAL